MTFEGYFIAFQSTLCPSIRHSVVESCNIDIVAFSYHFLHTTILLTRLSIEERHCLSLRCILWCYRLLIEFLVERYIVAIAIPLTFHITHTQKLAVFSSVHHKDTIMAPYKLNGLIIGRNKSSIALSTFCHLSWLKLEKITILWSILIVFMHKLLRQFHFDSVAFTTFALNP